jgi:hypothetical protein
MIAFLVCEIILRIIGFSVPHFYTYDDVLGHRFIPGAEGWHRQEGEAYITINSHGLRDREHTIEKPPHTIRIAVLGDSYAEARQVPLEETFWSIMERKMNACQPFGGHRVEVINFGVSGNGTAQEFLTLQLDGWKYSPDIVLLAFLTGNDIRNNSKTLEPKKWKPFFVLQDDTLVLDTSFVNDPVYRWKSGWLWSIRLLLFRYSRTHQFISTVKKRYTSKITKKNPIQGEEVGLDDVIYAEPKDPDWQEAWKITETILVKMQEEIEQRDARFVIVTLSNGIQVHPDPDVQRRFMEQLNINDLLYPDRRIKQFGAQQGIEVLTLAPMLQQYAEKHNVFLHGFENRTPGFGHWNHTGHRVAGEIIAEYFCRAQ